MMLVYDRYGEFDVVGKVLKAPMGHAHFRSASC
jgi:hypothetical protein